MTLADVFYLVGIVLMMSFIILMIIIIIGAYFLYKKVKQLEVRAQAKMDVFQTQLFDRKGVAFRALPMMTFVMPFLFKMLRRWKR